MGRTRCLFHGGATPRGIASANFKHGRYSKDLPTRLKDKYLEAINDPDLLDLSDEIGLLEMRIKDMMGRLDIGEAGATWKNLVSTFLHFENATGRNDKAVAIRALADVRALIMSGNEDWASWDAILRLMEQRRKMADTERRRRVDMKQMIRSDKMAVMVSAIVNVVNNHVTDRSTRIKIGNDISALIFESS